MSRTITYQVETALAVAEFLEVLEASTLGQRRPVTDHARIEAMLQHANLVVTARNEQGLLLGIARCLTDYGYCTYLSDLAVRTDHQGQGIGRALIREVKLAAPLTKIILISAPAAVHFYPKIGMTHHPYAYTLSQLEELR